jgi:antitoxin YefM
MNAVTITEAKANLEQIIEQVIADVEPTIISTDTGQHIVLLPLEELSGAKRSRPG